MQTYLGVKLIDAEPQKRPLDATGKTNGEEGYKVVYESGYVSWSPKDVFEEAYRPITNLTFGLATEALKRGEALARVGWNGKDLFIFKQVPAQIGKDVIPKMQSVPTKIKKIILSRISPVLNYTNQICIVNSDGRVDSWVASVSDIFGEDWFIIQ